MALDLELRNMLETLGPDAVLGRDDQELLKLVAGFREEVTGRIARDAVTDDDYAELCAFGALHPHVVVRSAIVDIAIVDPSNSYARRLLAWAVLDPSDQIAAKALKACRDFSITEAVDEVYTACRRNGARVSGNVSGVSDIRDITAAAALAALVGSEPDPFVIARELELSTVDRTVAPQRVVDTTRMAHVEAGPVKVGVGKDEITFAWFSVDESSALRELNLDGFFIDVEPVTGREYEAFVAFIEEH